MADLRTRARAALAARLAELVPPGALHPAGAHTLRWTDALVPAVDPAAAAWAHAQLAARAKGELRPTRAGAVPAHAAWSSTALVCSAFAPWHTRPGELRLAGLGPWDELRLEERLAIPHGGGSPNLDVALLAAGARTGIEAKLTEHLAPARPRPWRPAYHRPAMAAGLDGPWRALFEDLLAGRWSPRHLDAGQLVRHALSLRGAGELVLLFWEPANGADHPEVLTHRAEVTEVLERVAGGVPRLHARTWAEALDGWAPRASGLVAALRERYDVAVPPAGGAAPPNV